MQLIIESTDRGLMLESELCQIWTGCTENGTEVLVYLRGISSLKFRDREALKQEINNSMQIGHIEAYGPILPNLTGKGQ